MDSAAAQKRRYQKAQFFKDLDKLDQYMHDDSDGSIHTCEEQQSSPPLHGSFTRMKQTSTEVYSQERKIFSGLTFFFIPNQSLDRIRKVRIEKAVTLGATWTRVFDDHTSHIIVDDKLDIKEALKDLGNARDASKTPMVRMRWLVDCFRDQTLHDPHRSIFRVRGMKEPFCKMDNDGLQFAAPMSSAGESASTMCEPFRPELDSKVTEDEFTQAMELVQKVGLLDYQPFVDAESVAEGAQPGQIGERFENTGGFNSGFPDFLCKQKNDGSSTNPNLQTMCTLQQLANHYERVGDKWRNLSYRKAITALRHQQRPVRTKEEALSIRGIGKSIAEKIEEISTTGHLRKLEMAEADPQEQRLMVFMGIYGVGLKQARMWLNQGHRTLEDLLQNAELTPSQRIGAEHYQDFQARIPREEVRKHAAIVSEVLGSVDSELQVIIGGSYRRGKPDCGDIDLLITKADAGLGHIRTLMTQYAIPELEKRGFLKAELSSSHSDDSGSKWHGASALPGSSVWRRLDLLYMPWDERGAAMIYFTGNDIFNRSMRLLASWKGMRLNQHGLYRDVMRVLQYFDRGSKLGDSSNRYQHTCKACGALFPKGRIEGLVNHLTKKCPSLAPSQKQHIIIQFYNLSPDTNFSLPEASNRQADGRTTFPVPVKQNFHSLNILAEASRCVGSTASTTINQAKDAGGFVSFDSHLDAGIPLDPTLDMDSFTHSYLHDEDGLHTTINNLEAAHRPELSSIAASAAEMLPSGGVQASDLPRSTIDEEMDILSADKTKKLVTSLERQPDPGVPAPMLKEARFVAEPGTSFKSARPKVRGKFGPVRRQEVREMRQRGACLRCRMLKKTCSNGSPCQACAAIETPRIWKTPCVRTKLVNEFGLYAARLYNTTTFRELTQVRLQAMLQENTGLVEFYHLDGTPTGLSFQGTRLDVVEGDHKMQTAGDGTVSEKGSRLECIILNSETEEIARAMGTYVQKSQDIQTLAANESGCLRASLRTLAAIVEQKNDGLLSRILLLWTSTILLIDRSHLLWEAVVVPSLLLESDQLEQTRGAAWSSLPTPSKVSNFSNRLMNDQLRAGVETQAQRLNKAILCELERRLVQKQRDGYFEIFIGLVVLLNCFERMCWAFKAQESAQPPNKWPFSQSSADDFVCEGERFADIIEVLADMRSLIPKTRFDSAQNILLPLRSNDINETTTDTTVGGHEHLVLDWFQQAAITKEYLQDINNDSSRSNSKAKPFDPTDLRSMDVYPTYLSISSVDNTIP
ncbi:hypothetical protein DV738_g151, partial [Chaetothyriales sp. CBS 135597]